jgi:hypothetical protein
VLEWLLVAVADGVFPVAMAAANRPKADIRPAALQAAATDCRFNRSTQHFVRKSLRRENVFESKK